MQVKKFEASSMKEALDLVKTHMGPDAIILSAKDISKSFGLVGEKSVEVTAAVSSSTLQKKKLAEQKLNERDKNKFAGSSARMQKEFIDKVFNQYSQQQVKRPTTAVPYIEIDESGEAEQAQQPAEMRVPAAEVSPSAPLSHLASAKQRIKSAVMEASIAASVIEEQERPPAPKPKPTAPIVPDAEHSAHYARLAQEKNKEIQRLQTEIQQMKKLLEGFQRVPQNMMTMHPGAEYGLPYEMSPMYQKLTRAGITVENTVECLKAANEVLSQEQLKRAGTLDAWVVKNILDSVKVASERLDDRFQVFLGPAGQGKTSSLVKLASHLVICDKKKVAIVTTDIERIGAAEQLRIFAQILNVPFAIAKSAADWQHLERELRHVDHVFVDTPGLNLRSMIEMDQLRALLPPETGGRRMHYVQSMLARDDDAIELAERYKSLGLDDVVFTRLDEAAQHGLIYNFHRKLGIPLHSFGIGAQIPEDIESATKERVVDLIFKLTKVNGKRSK